ncbi:PX domain-containing protein EREX [Linum perenne]
MSLYIHDLALLDSGDFSDPFLDRFSLSHLHNSSSWSASSLSSSSSFTDAVSPDQPFPPPHRHDGTSPLPLGMDWTPPPRQSDGEDSISGHNAQTGWKYWITVPSWIVMPNPADSNRATGQFYRVQVGLQSPDGVTNSREILRRFSDFLKLHSELKMEFPVRKLPPAPPKRILKLKSKSLLEERRCSLENWIEQLLSDIYVSRSAAVGIFFELEATVRSFFNGMHESSNFYASSMAPPIPSQTIDNLSTPASSSGIASDHYSDSLEEVSGSGTTKDENHNYVSLLTSAGNDEERKDIISTHARLETSKEKAVCVNIISLLEIENEKLDDHTDSSVNASETLNLGMESGGAFPEEADTSKVTDVPVSSAMKIPDGSLVAFPSYEHKNLKRILDKLMQRQAIAKTDIIDLIGRLNQEVAMKQFLMTRVKDLESDLETTKHSCKESMQQAALVERERFTQLQWDVEELHNKCLEVELKLKSEQYQRVHLDLVNNSLVKENEMLMKQLVAAKEELDKMHKQLDEVDLKSKSEVKLLVKEVKSLRSSHSELRQEVTSLMKKNEDLEGILLKEREKKANITTANGKLLHECEMLCDRLRQCSVNFLIGEKNNIVVDSSLSDAIDLLETSNNRIGLLLAEAQLLTQDVIEASTPLPNVDNRDTGLQNDAADTKLRNMLAETFINFARTKMELNSVIRCALNAADVGTEEQREDVSEAPKERAVLLSNIIERIGSATSE